MFKAVDINAVLQELPLLKDRTRHTSEAEAGPAFATLAEFGDGGIFAGSFQGESSWERHPAGDEIVQVLGGRTRLTILTGEGEQVLEMSAGHVTVVPKGCWHRFEAPEGVTVMTATPLPTEHSVEDPKIV
jgi:uncharacterized cupin superfamily protein